MLLRRKIPVAAVADEYGEIQWFLTDELQVIEIDGVKVGEIIAKHIAEKRIPLEFSREVCPACGAEISVEDAKCPFCDLVFQIEDE